MQCPHCRISVHLEWSRYMIATISDEESMWHCEAEVCPSCEEPIVRVVNEKYSRTGAVYTWQPMYYFAYPQTPRRTPVDDAVPEPLKTEFIEATDVLPISSKASAALSRRILQSILEEQGYAGRDLAKQIDNVLNETDSQKVLPVAIRKTVDAIRNFGNFAAHPIKDKGRLQEVIEVEPHEAEWCIEIVEALFNHYYVMPAENAKRMNALNKKLQDAGKPSAKS